MNYWVNTYVSEVKRDLQVLDKLLGKFRIHLEHVKEVVTVYLVKVTVGQSPHVTARLAYWLVQADVLSKNVILSWITKQPCCVCVCLFTVTVDISEISDRRVSHGCFTALYKVQAKLM